MINVEPMRAELKELTSEIWHAEAVLEAVEVERLLLVIRSIWKQLLSIQATNEAMYGQKCAKCPTCDRPALEIDGWGEWCEYCYHEMRPTVQESERAALCVACRKLVVQEPKCKRKWCKTCEGRFVPILRDLEEFVV